MSRKPTRKTRGPALITAEECRIISRHPDSIYWHKAILQAADALEAKDHQLDFAVRAGLIRTKGAKIMTCRHCGRPVDRARIEQELRTRTGDIPETRARAATASVFCGLDCALGDFTKERTQYVGPNDLDAKRDGG